MADWFRKLFSTGAVAFNINNTNIRKVPKDDDEHSVTSKTVTPGQITYISSSHNDDDDGNNVDDVGKEYVFNPEMAGKPQQEEKEKGAESLSLNDDNNDNTILQQATFWEDDTNNGNEREGILFHETCNSDLEKAVNFRINEMETELNEASQENLDITTNNNNLQVDIMEEETYSISLNQDMVDDIQTNIVIKTNSTTEQNESKIKQVTNDINLDDEINLNIFMDNTRSNSVAIEVPVPMQIRLVRFLSLTIIPLLITLFYAYASLEESQREFNFYLFGSFIMGFITILYTITNTNERPTAEPPQLFNHETDMEPNSDGWVIFD